MSRKSSDKARSFLEKMGVRVLTNTKATGCDQKTVFIDSGESISTYHLTSFFNDFRMLKYVSITAKRSGNTPVRINSISAGNLSQARFIICCCPENSKLRACQ